MHFIVLTQADDDKRVINMADVSNFYPMGHGTEIALISIPSAKILVKESIKDIMDALSNTTEK